MQPATSTRQDNRRLRAPAAVLLAVAAAVLIGLFDVAPVRSQIPILEAAPTSVAVPTDDAWATVWNDAPSLRVPLSAQDIAFPYGGGAVDAVTVRSLYDEERLYISIEWADHSADDSVSGAAEFSDAAALQFSADPLKTPPYTMGSPGAPVNIWQWKAVWQADAERGFPSTTDRYPNTHVDGYPGEGNPLYNPAAHLGNPLAPRTHASLIENLLAEGFGTLTSLDVQDVEGSGAWRNDRWRVVFARTLAPGIDGLASFETHRTAVVAFAVWDGASGDRNGQKSVAQFIELDIGPVERVAVTDEQAQPPGTTERGIPWVALGLILSAVLPLLAMAAIVFYRTDASDIGQPAQRNWRH
ncbi:MAG: hypothetical protein GY720_08655 [bacterium]|nr:hypothetical protein [bacterium]